jgi:Pyruvate/2-oxoacid:ferredoxin oxidoreductase delta subunit
MAIARVDGAYRVSADHCKGCGLCARECPRGALAMAAER